MCFHMESCSGERRQRQPVVSLPPSPNTFPWLSVNIEIFSQFLIKAQTIVQSAACLLFSAPFTVLLQPMDYFPPFPDNPLSTFPLPNILLSSLCLANSNSSPMSQTPLPQSLGTKGRWQRVHLNGGTFREKMDLGGVSLWASDSQRAPGRQACQKKGSIWLYFALLQRCPTVAVPSCW